MSLQIRLSDFITAVGTDYKTLRTWLTGSSTGDLTGLTTTAKSSIIAAINEVKASATGSPPVTTEATSGVIRTATQAEVTAGTLDLVAVSPLKLKTASDAAYQAKSANLTALAGFTTSTDAALAANSDTVLATQKAVKAYADALLDANNAYQYKGVIDASANPNYPAASAGWTYKISVAGKIGGASGVNVEIGDSITCLVDSSAAGNQATVGANWLVLQSNVDGAVVGPTTSVAGNIPTFSGTTGKVVTDSGISVDTDGTLTANSNTKVPTDAAIRTYLGANYYNQAAVGNPETDLVALYTTAKA
jgi:hypothetical protein